MKAGGVKPPHDHSTQIKRTYSTCRHEGNSWMEVCKQHMQHASDVTISTMKVSPIHSAKASVADLRPHDDQLPVNLPLVSGLDTGFGVDDPPQPPPGWLCIGWLVDYGVCLVVYLLDVYSGSNESVLCPDMGTAMTGHWHPYGHWLMVLVLWVRVVQAVVLGHCQGCPVSVSSVRLLVVQGYAAGGGWPWPCSHASVQGHCCLMVTVAVVDTPQLLGVAQGWHCLAWATNIMSLLYIGVGAERKRQTVFAKLFVYMIIW